MASAGAASIPENPNPVPDPNPNPPPPTDGEQPISKKAAKKLAAKLEKQKRQGESAAAASAAAAEGEDDPLSGNYGDLPLSEIQSKEEVQFPYTSVDALGHELKDSVVLVRGTAQTVRAVGKKMAFVVLRDGWSTVQCVVAEKQGSVSKGMVKFVAALSRESVVDVEGVISVPEVAITGATQQVEIQVTKLYCISKASPNLPFNLEDAARSDAEIEEQQLVRVNQDTRLNFRYFDLRTPANQAIFQIQSEVSRIFGEFLRSESFREIHTPKLIAGSSEGGSAVFHLDYKGQAACLAQSPQLHKQMAITGRFRRVFEIGPVFRAEDSFTHRHLCEFTGLDVEMEIKKHYFEVMDIVDRLFVKMFNTLKSECSSELEAIARQYPFEPLKYLEKTLRLPFQEGIEMLKADGVDVDPLGDLNTATERRLGQLVREKYGTDFYILYRYPLAVRPFYTMPCYDDSNYSNSFDVFIRGEEIISGAQRVHIPELLTERAQACGIDVSTIKTYIDAFRYGTPPHGGFGVGLERVVMLYFALNNIRKTSLFPRDPTRIAP